MSHKFDPNQIAARVVAKATHGEFTPIPQQPKKNRAAVSLGRRGGKVGGPARAAALTPEQRTAIAKKGADLRWGPSITYKAWRFPIRNIGGFIFEDFEPAKLEMEAHGWVSTSGKVEKILIIVKLNGEHYPKSFLGVEAHEVRALLVEAGIEDITHG